MRNLVVLWILGILLVPAPQAPDKNDATAVASRFLSAFLVGQYEAAAELTDGDPKAWIEALTTQLPGDEPLRRFEIVDVFRGPETWTCVIWLERGESAQAFYVDINDKHWVTRFYSILEISAPYLEELNAAAEGTREEIRQWSFRNADELSFVNSLTRQIKTLDDYKKVLQRHINVVRRVHRQ